MQPDLQRQMSTNAGSIVQLHPARYLPPSLTPAATIRGNPTAGVSLGWVFLRSMQVSLYQRGHAVIDPSYPNSWLQVA